MRKLSLFLALVALVATGLGCDDNSPTAPVAQDTEPVPLVVDTFTGSLVLAGSSCHVFTAVNRGPTELMLTSLAPLPTLTVGLGIGLDDADPATDCPFFAIDRSVRVSETLLSQLTAVGTYCVCVFDVGNIFADQTVSYTLEVEHP